MLDCNDKEACTADSCDKVKGCLHSTLQGLCDDGNPCTEGESCQAGQCKGKDKVCDDSDSCTSNACDSIKGCMFAVNPKACDDGNGCTDDNCEKVKGCWYVNNTVPCDAKNPCTVGDACSGGTCKAGSQSKFFTVPDLGAGAAARVTHLAARSDGGVFATLWTAGSAKVGVSAVSATGTVLWFTPAIGDHWSTSLLDIVATPDGGVVVAGYTSIGAAGGIDGLLLRLDKQGKKVWEYTYGGAKDDALAGIALLADGSIVAVSSTYSYGTSADGWWLHLSSEGVVSSAATLGGSALDALWRVASTVDGGAVAVGRTEGNGAGGLGGWMVRANAAGKPTWQHSYGTVHNDALYAVAVLPDGDVVAGGLGWASKIVTDGWLLRTDPAGMVKWQRLTGKPWSASTYGITRILPSADGSLAALHTGTFSAAQGYAGLVQLDGNGANLSDGPSWSGAWDYDTVRTPDGGIWVGRVPGKTEAPLWPLSPWGQTGCAEAGKCAAPTWQDCQDKNPCTTGTCDPVKGCVQNNNTDPCDAGATCTAADSCSGGACQPGKPKLFDTAIGTAANDEVLGAFRTRGGDFVTTGYQGTECWVRKTNGGGTLLRDSVVNFNSTSYCRGGVERRTVESRSVAEQPEVQWLPCLIAMETKLQLD